MDPREFYKSSYFDAHIRKILKLNLDAYARQGISEVEILFRGHRVFSTRGGVSGRTFNKTNLKLDLSAHPPARSGSYHLQAKVVDRLGKVATKLIRLRVDMKPPAITSIRPGDGETIFSARSYAYARRAEIPITIDISAKDDYSGVRIIYLRNLYAGLTRHEYGSPCRITIPGRLGENPITILVEDRAENSTEMGITVNAQAGPPLRGR